MNEAPGSVTRAQLVDLAARFTEAGYALRLDAQRARFITDTLAWRGLTYSGRQCSDLSELEAGFVLEALHNITRARARR